MSNNWSNRGKRWQEDYIEGLKSLYSAKNTSEIDEVVQPPTKVAKKAKVVVESERRAQQRLVQWLHEIGVPFYAVPNGANVAPHHRQTLLSEGLSPGVPDLVIPIPSPSRGYHSLYIELKRETGGVVSEAQKKWIDRLNGYGHRAVVCHGFDKAKEEIEWYLTALPC